MKHILHTTLFLVGLFGTSAWVRSLDEFPFWGALQRKVNHLAYDLGAYDTLFIGSSRAHNGFIPEVFDARMAELGTPTRSFNFALEGLRQHDYGALLDWLLSRDVSKLDYLLIELHAWVQGPRNENWMTAYEFEIHPWPYWGERLQSILCNHDGFSAKVEQAVHATAHVLANMFRIGQAPRILDAELRRRNGELPWRHVPVDNEGGKELSTETVGEQRIRQHEKWLARSDDAARSLASKRRDIAPKYLRGGFNAAAMRNQIAKIRAAGIEPIFVIMPHYAGNFFGRDGVAAFRDEVVILELDDPNDHEDLYELAHWFDWAHMLKPGAELASRRIADHVHALPARKR